MKLLALAVVTAMLASSGAASAQSEHFGDRSNDRQAEQSNDHRGDRADSNQHSDWGRDYGQRRHHWRRGQRIGYNDWSSARAIDYREHHLRQPPYGYEWREYNGQYVLAAVATGVIASIIMNSGR